MNPDDDGSLRERVPVEAVAILDFWFGSGWRNGAVVDDPEREAMWWQGGPDADAYIRSRFGEAHERAAAGGLDEWALTPAGRLALILVLDQFSRQIYRDRPEAYALDGRAQLLCLTGLDRGSDQALGPLQRVFFYMPLEHAEDRSLQLRSVHLFEQLLDEVSPDDRPRFERYLDFARKHREVVEQFGRFPHRNEVLGRESDHHEARFLRLEGRGF